jgi:tRNA pseudouridine32 synthase / 23S rRNA pseudouridine746 synthase
MLSESHQPVTPATIFQDNDLIVVNKPPGLLSVPDGYDPNLPHLKSILEPQFGPLWIVHRLDKETSGLVILAKNQISHRELNAFFRNRQVQKVYHGLVTPPPDFQEKTIQLPLKPNADRKHRTRVDHHEGKRTHSIVKTLKRFELGALVEITISTGITHQIRAHLRAHELVLFGETLYSSGLPPQQLNAPRTMLHAREVAFPHPISNDALHFGAPYPEDFREVYTKLRFTKALDELT